MRLIIYSIYISVVSFSACSLFQVGDGSSNNINLEELQQHWVQSYEEESQGSDINIYRPNDYKEFPPSRFRMQYIFEEDGNCEWYYLAPNDGHQFKVGKWKIGTEDKEVIIIEQGEQVIRYRIVELSEEVLRLKLIKTD